MSTANVSNASNQNDDGAPPRVVASTAEVQAILDDAFKKRAAAEAERDDLKQWLDLTKARLDSSESFVSSLQQSIEEHSGTARLRRHEVREVKKEFRCLFVEVRTALDDNYGRRTPADAIASLKVCLEKHQPLFDLWFGDLELEDDMASED